MKIDPPDKLPAGAELPHDRTQDSVAPRGPHAAIENSVGKLALPAGDRLLQCAFAMLGDKGANPGFIVWRRRPCLWNDEVMDAGVGGVRNGRRREVAEIAIHVDVVFVG